MPNNELYTVENYQIKTDRVGKTSSKFEL